MQKSPRSDPGPDPQFLLVRFLEGLRPRESLYDSITMCLQNLVAISVMLENRFSPVPLDGHVCFPLNLNDPLNLNGFKTFCDGS